VLHPELPLSRWESLSVNVAIPIIDIINIIISDIDNHIGHQTSSTLHHYRRTTQQQ